MNPQVDLSQFDITQLDVVGLVFGVFGFIKMVLLAILWIFLTITFVKFLWGFLKAWWMDEVQSRFVKNEFRPVMLELKFPRNNDVFPKAMDNIFAAIYQMYTFGVPPEQVIFGGHVEATAIFEIISSPQGVRYFVTIDKKFRFILEKAFYANYPGTEVIPVERDYLEDLPENLPNEDYDIHGSDIKMLKNNAYPIKTYISYFGERNRFEEYETDPMSHVAEVMSGITSPYGRIWLQICIQPTGELLKVAQAEIDRIMGKKKPVSVSFTSELVSDFFAFVKNLVLAPSQVPDWSSNTPQKTESKDKILNVIETEAVKAIDKKRSKPGFWTSIRFLYIDKREYFDKANFQAMLSSFQYHATQNLNALKPGATLIKPERFFGKKSSILKRKRDLYRYYRSRSVWPYSNIEDYLDELKTKIPFFSTNPLTKDVGFKRDLPLPFLLNTEELASVFHPPVSTRTEASGINPIETKKAPPPVNLPIDY